MPAIVGHKQANGAAVVLLAVLDLLIPGWRWRGERARSGWW